MAKFEGTCDVVVQLWHRLFFTADDDEVFMTRSLNVTPKTTQQQHLIECNDYFIRYQTEFA